MPAPFFVELVKKYMPKPSFGLLYWGFFIPFLAMIMYLFIAK